MQSFQNTRKHFAFIKETEWIDVQDRTEGGNINVDATHLKNSGVAFLLGTHRIGGWKKNSQSLVESIHRGHHWEQSRHCNYTHVLQLFALQRKVARTVSNISGLLLHQYPELQLIYHAKPTFSELSKRKKASPRQHDSQFRRLASKVQMSSRNPGKSASPRWCHRSEW